MTQIKYWQKPQVGLKRVLLPGSAGGRDVGAGLLLYLLCYLRARGAIKGQVRPGHSRKRGVRAWGFVSWTL